MIQEDPELRIKIVHDLLLLMKETKGMKIVILNISDDGKGSVISAK